jgi:hypothetical protein
MTELRTEPREEEELSTADMVASAERASPETASQQEMAAREEMRGAPEAASQAAASATPLFLEQNAQALRSRWDSIQTAFVDNPRQAVEEADHLVAQTIKQLAEVFANERRQLEQQWSRGDDVSTEDLRIALQRYRSFFDRLLSV